MTRITEFATEPQKSPLTPRINSVPLQITEKAIAKLAEGIASN